MEKLRVQMVIPWLQIRLKLATIVVLVPLLVTPLFRKWLTLLNALALKSRLRCLCVAPPFPVRRPLWVCLLVVWVSLVVPIMVACSGRRVEGRVVPVVEVVVVVPMVGELTTLATVISSSDAGGSGYA